MKAQTHCDLRPRAAPDDEGREAQRALTRRGAKPVEERPISPRRDVGAVTDLLLRAQGPESALKRAANERASARRARSRQRFQFWLAISAEIEARQARDKR